MKDLVTPDGWTLDANMGRFVSPDGLRTLSLLQLAYHCYRIVTEKEAADLNQRRAK